MTNQAAWRVWHSNGSNIATADNDHSL